MSISDDRPTMPTDIRDEPESTAKAMRNLLRGAFEDAKRQARDAALEECERLARDATPDAPQTDYARGYRDGMLQAAADIAALRRPG